MSFYCNQSPCGMFPSYQNCCRPVVINNISRCCPTPPTPPPVVPIAQLTGMQVQLVGADQTLIADGENIIFNSIITNLSPDITYNSITGVFTVTEAGVYYADWWVNTDGASEATTILLTLEFSSGPAISASTPSPFTTVQLNGQALVSLPAGTTFSLVNNSGSTIALATSQIQADLSIMKVVTI